MNEEQTLEEVKEVEPLTKQHQEVENDIVEVNEEQPLEEVKEVEPLPNQHQEVEILEVQ